jgi:hypothetical protein
MDFHEVLEHVLVLLQRHRRVSYRALKRQFDLDDATLGDLKEELLYAHPVVDDEGKGRIWTDEAESKPEPGKSPKPAQTSDQPVTEPVQPTHAKAPPDAERRQLTVMFCDLADSTRLSGQLGLVKQGLTTIAERLDLVDKFGVRIYVAGLYQL